MKKYKIDPIFMLDSFRIESPFTSVYHCIRYTTIQNGVAYGSVLFSHIDDYVQLTLVTTTLPYVEEVQYKFPNVNLFNEYSRVLYQILKWAGYKLLQNVYGETLELQEQEELFYSRWMKNMPLIDKFLTGCDDEELNFDFGTAPRLDEDEDDDGYSDYDDEHREGIEV